MLESGNLLIGQGVRLGNDGDEVDLGVKSLHDLDIQGLQGVASRLDEEDAGMDPVVHNVHAIDLVLSIQVGIEALFNIVHNWAPGFVVVDEIAEARGVDNGQAEPNTGLLDICADGLDSHGLGNDVEARLLALLGRVEGSIEESVDERRLSKPRFTWKKSQKSETCLPRYGKANLPTTITLKLNPLRTLLRCHWFGRLAKPTYPVSFLRTMFLASFAEGTASFWLEFAPSEYFAFDMVTHQRVLGEQEMPWPEEASC